MTDVGFNVGKLTNLTQLRLGHNRIQYLEPSICECMCVYVCMYVCVYVCIHTHLLGLGFRFF